MKATELRVGNYLNANGKLISVNRINENGFITWKIGDIYNPYIHINDERIKPIPLTPEWLERFGFEYSHRIGQRIFYNIGNIYIECGAENGMCAVYCRSESVTCFIHYVHQLQNLYFALTGEELTLAPRKEVEG